MPLAAGYTLRLAPGVLPFFLFIVFRQSLQSLHRTAAIVAAIVVANLVNAGLNWLLIFGRGSRAGAGRARLRLGHDRQPVDAVRGCCWSWPRRDIVP